MLILDLIHVSKRNTGWFGECYFICQIPVFCIFYFGIFHCLKVWRHCLIDTVQRSLNVLSALSAHLDWHEIYVDVMIRKYLWHHLMIFNASMNILFNVICCNRHALMKMMDIYSMHYAPSVTYTQLCIALFWLYYGFGVDSNDLLLICRYLLFTVSSEIIFQHAQWSTQQ